MHRDRHSLMVQGAGDVLRSVSCAGLMLLAMAGAPRPADAQIVDYETLCRAQSGGQTTLCRAGLDALDIAIARALILGEGGNPVPGTASTMGHRMGTSPRVGLSGRVTVANIELPRLAPVGGTNSGAGLGLTANVAVGLLNGISAGPTVGGVGSLDFVASIGITHLPGGAEFTTSHPVTWAVGGRLGVLRESFTAPGISLSALYRRLGALAVGNEFPGTDSAYVFTNQTAAWSTRAAIGKHLGPLGLTGGVGWTRFSTDAAVRLFNTSQQPIDVRNRSFHDKRLSAFGNVSWTVLILTVSGEAGWQSAGDLTAGGRQTAGAAGGGLFGSIAGRLTI